MSQRAIFFSLFLAGARHAWGTLAFGLEVWLIWQAGPVVNVYMPKDRVTSTHQGYGFVEFRGEDDADYAVKVGKP